MSKEELLLDRINRGCTISDACSTLDFDIEEVKGLLSSCGLRTKEIVFSDGTKDLILETFDRSLGFKEEERKGFDFAIYTKPELSFKVAAYTDLHLTHSTNHIDYLKMAYDVVAKENVHHILNVGDLCDGMFGSSRYHLLPNDQAEYLVNHHPYDKFIFNWYILGDHDMSLWTLDKPRDVDSRNWYTHTLSKKDIQEFKPRIDLKNYLNDNRNDFICIGIKNGRIHLKNEIVQLLHHSYKETSCVDKNAKLVLRGHSHTYDLRKKGNSTEFFIPPLSDLQFRGTNPSMFIFEFNFENGYFKNILVTEYNLKITRKGGKLEIAKKFEIKVNPTKNKKSYIEYEDKRLIK